jgi:hypothetical protein
MWFKGIATTTVFRLDTARLVAGLLPLVSMNLP